MNRTGQLRLVPLLDLAPSTAEVQDRVMAVWQEVLDRTEYVGGRFVQGFEQRFAAYCGVTEAVGVGSGTDAIQLGLRALGIGAGDEVIVPANTFVATVEAVVLTGARPRFVDVDPDTLLVTADAVRAAVTPATRAVVAVHLYGHVPDMDSLTETASALGLVLIEDAAQAPGATWRGRRVGSFGAIGCFSFSPSSNLGAFGDAGLVTTSHPEVAARLQALRDHGRAGARTRSHVEVGTNSRLDALQAVVLDAKLDRLEAWNRSRRRLANVYQERLADSLAAPVAELPRSRGAQHFAVVRVDERDQVRHRLASQGIVTGIHYPTPCHLMKPYAQFADRPLPVAEQAAQRVLSLPLHPHLDMDDVVYVADRLRDVTGG